MEKEILSIDSDIEKITNGSIIQRKEMDYKWIIVVIIGLSMSYIQSVVDPDNGAPTMALFIFGIVLILFGIIKLLSKKDVFYCGAERLTLTEMKQPNSYDILKVLHNEGFTKVYVQNFKFEDYVYKPFDEVRLLDDAESQKVAALIRAKA
ncbi:MAG: hypothetical protein II956_01105 [Bacteroidales bacterium]|nr:hypothetical protein [Bacteroidales bacterium]